MFMCLFPFSSLGNVSRNTFGSVACKYKQDVNSSVGIHQENAHMTSYEEGFLMGVLVGEGHFGGDRAHAHVILHMHERHQKLLTWFLVMVPGSKLYGPYLHNGRHCMQWMARGKVLREVLLPILLRNYDGLDEHIQFRISRMIRKYKLCEQSLLKLPLPGALVATDIPLPHNVSDL
jgi:hypothetical protein